MIFILLHPHLILRMIYAPKRKEGRKEMFYLTTHSTHFIYGYMASNTERGETRCSHYMGYSFRLAARVLLYVSSYRQGNTYHGLCYTRHGALAGTRNSSMSHQKGCTILYYHHHHYCIYVCIFCMSGLIIYT